LFTLAIAQVKKTNTHVGWVIEGLRHTSKAKWQTLNAKLNLHTPKDTNREGSIRAHVAPTDADVDDSAVHVSSQIYQVKNNAGIDSESLLKTTRSANIWRRLRGGTYT
jgi:hypothetical protein